MLVPDPADGVGRVVLVLRKPELAFFADYVKDLWKEAWNVSYGLYPKDNNEEDK